MKKNNYDFLISIIAGTVGVILMMIGGLNLFTCLGIELLIFSGIQWSYHTH